MFFNFAKKGFLGMSIGIPWLLCPFLLRGKYVKVRRNKRQERKNVSKDKIEQWQTLSTSSIVTLLYRSLLSSKPI